MFKRVDRLRRLELSTEGVVDFGGDAFGGDEVGVFDGDLPGDLLGDLLDDFLGDHLFFLVLCGLSK